MQVPSSKFQDPRSKIQDPRSKIQDPRSKIQDPRSKSQVPSKFQIASSKLSGSMKREGLRGIDKEEFGPGVDLEGSTTSGRRQLGGLVRGFFVDSSLSIWGNRSTDWVGKRID